MTRKELEGFFEEIEELWCDLSDAKDLIDHLEIENAELQNKIVELEFDLKRECGR